MQQQNSWDVFLKHLFSRNPPQHIIRSRVKGQYWSDTKPEKNKGCQRSHKGKRPLALVPGCHDNVVCTSQPPLLLVHTNSVMHTRTLTGLRYHLRMHTHRLALALRPSVQYIRAASTWHWALKVIKDLSSKIIQTLIRLKVKAQNAGTKNCQSPLKKQKKFHSFNKHSDHPSDSHGRESRYPQRDLFIDVFFSPEDTMGMVE